MIEQIFVGFAATPIPAGGEKEKEKDIKISEKDVNNEIDKIIKESKEDKKKVTDFFLDENNKSSLASNLLNEKLFAYISEFSVIKDKEKSTSELRKQKYSCNWRKWGHRTDYIYNPRLIWR